jgi:hypothetical protein
MTLRSSRMTVTIISFALIFGLSFVDTDTSKIAVGTIGTITLAFIGGKTFTDSKRNEKS